MQFLPEILKLQKQLFDQFHQKMGQENILQDTVGKYKDSFVKGDGHNF